ncbi:hypothetical protein Dvul_0231 [Nitratidesulfovibrio vulgaris DP4]|uniref:Uncharacterized protein n=1 Tax=Nitratidesulfovibrio vulgaris (strain DP4) TaxID=391774 RepID=A0A0H3A5I1_NITV4|nr:hypothetical protein Dvul_0231 [Nitratidesulfovibrio vulgaris DP4]
MRPCGKYTQEGVGHGPPRQGAGCVRCRVQSERDLWWCALPGHCAFSLAGCADPAGLDGAGLRDAGLRDEGRRAWAEQEAAGCPHARG